MARSSKLSTTIQEDQELHGQLSLFNGNASKSVEENPAKKEAAPASNVKPMVKARKSSSSNYSAADIQVLEGIAAIRHRPGMYIGSTSATGLLHLIWEALDNAVDEAAAGVAEKTCGTGGPAGWGTVPVERARRASRR